MAAGECPNPRPDCKYAPDCFSDKHHIYGRPPKGIARRFSLLPENTVQLCRVEHEEVHATEGVLPLPDIETMKQIIRGNNGTRT